MAANGYGMGNLPMDLYKMCVHDVWDYNGRANGQGDYRKWGIYRITAYDQDGNNCGFWQWCVDGTWLFDNWYQMLDDNGLDRDVWTVDYDDSYNSLC